MDTKQLTPRTIGFMMSRRYVTSMIHELVEALSFGSAETFVLHLDSREDSPLGKEEFWELNNQERFKVIGEPDLTMSGYSICLAVGNAMEEISKQIDPSDIDKITEEKILSNTTEITETEQ